MKGRYEVCGQELKLKDYIKLERNLGYDHTVTDEFLDDRTFCIHETVRKFRSV